MLPEFQGISSLVFYFDQCHYGYDAQPRCHVPYAKHIPSRHPSCRQEICHALDIFACVKRQSDDKNHRYHGDAPVKPLHGKDLNFPKISCYFPRQGGSWISIGTLSASSRSVIDICRPLLYYYQLTSCFLEKFFSKRRLCITPGGAQNYYTPHPGL
ncbi:MAG TPA: hypothetical protein PKY10_09870, partial [Lentisphaeria bacterium]|nr:hypothetical protein [Lentisphaeria bacterium]